jgi:hypothetical protein
MEALVNQTLFRISGISDSASLPEASRRSYLHWMISTAREKSEWPIDKRVRWLGFAAGMADVSRYGKDTARVERMLDCTQFLGNRIPKFDDIIHSGCDEVASGLEDIVEASGLEAVKRVEPLLCVARRCPTASLASYCLGYIQAYMTANEAIDVTAERDRTRPIFHRVYAACGYAIPASQSKD